MPDWVSRQLVWQGLTPWWLAAAHLSAVALAALLIVVLNRSERRLVSTTVGFALLSLRLLVLSLLLVTFLQPVLSWVLHEDRSGRILVAIDQSQSMMISDPHASRAERFHVIRGLQMIGHDDLQDQLDAWQAAFDRNEEPEWASVHDYPDAQEREQVAEARRENLKALLAELQHLTRVEIARRLLTTTPTPVLERLQKLAKVELFVFAGKSEAVDEAGLDRALAEPSASLRVDATDLGSILRLPAASPGTADQASEGQPQGTPVLGIVLLTDGRQTATASPLPAAAALGSSNIPIYPVLLGTQSRPKDLAIPSLDVPSTVFRQDEPLLKVVVQSAGFEGVPLQLEVQKVEHDTAQTVETRNFTPTGPHTPLEFKLPSAEVGRHSYVLKIPVQEGETHEDNNTRGFTIAVVDDRAKVLLIDSEPRWEFRYLEAAFARDERIDLKPVLFQQPYVGALPETFFPRTLPSDQPSPFDQIDVVILGDVAPWHLTEAQWSLLEKFVSDAGGTLVLCAGKSFLPAAYRSPLMERLSPMASVQTIALADAGAQAPPSRRGLRLELTPDAETQAMFHFHEHPNENRDIWSGLPGPVWAWWGTAKPAATVWVAARLPEQAGLDDERKQALIAHQHYGFGQVVWIGLDSTWRWRHRVGDKYHHQFWGQLVRWAVSNKIAAGNEFVRFGPERAEVAAGEDVVLRARWSPMFLERFPKLAVRAEIMRTDEPTDKPFATVDLTAKPNQNVIREGKVVNLPDGEYRARLVATDAELGPKPIEATFAVRPPSTPELIDTTANRPLLAQVAEASGGRLLFADEVHQLPDLITPRDASEDIYHESPLWDRGPILALFFGLLSIEWFLRKWNGLP